MAKRIELLAEANVLLVTPPVQRVGNNPEIISELLSRLLEAHERIIRIGSEAAAGVIDLGDQETGEFLVARVLRTNESHVWFLAQHLIPV